MRLSRITRYTVLILASVLPSIGGGLSAQTVLTTGEESRIWIEGRSNLSTFTCDAAEHRGRAVIEDRDEPEAGTEAESENSSDTSDGDLLTADNVTLDIKIPVKEFECGRQRMNRDLYEALQSNLHPYIHFELSRYRSVADSDDSENLYRVIIEGTLTIAGNSRDIRLTVTGEFLGDGQFRAAGKKKILMTDYNITPPVGLLGLVRAENELNVHFDLIANTPDRPEQR